ncbi:hypothetical protein POM88_050530 [Heracleum sosnowskyi]|uniref:Uncharacterized protein n=1 Tax=Heracleum sosnowskyi TaxID=360622 RepID=A0AAD8M2G6_9APIA|nr:hypothetical protein POM88_050530 [Heracleum sosnowskyi]
MVYGICCSNYDGAEMSFGAEGGKALISMELRRALEQEEMPATVDQAAPLIHAAVDRRHDEVYQHIKSSLCFLFSISKGLRRALERKEGMPASVDQAAPVIHATADHHHT